MPSPGFPSLPPDAATRDLFHATGRCSLGVFSAAWSSLGLCAIAIGEDLATVRTEVQGRFPGQRWREAGEAETELVAVVREVLESPGEPHSLPLDMRGTAFQKEVWRTLLAIPVGTTMTYAEVARKMGRPPRVARAVAGACAANPLAVVVPCHRVVRADRRLTGYRWGVERKRALLEREFQSCGREWEES